MVSAVGLSKTKKNQWLRLWMVWSCFKNYEKPVVSAMGGMVSLQKPRKQMVSAMDGMVSLQQP